MSKIAIRFALAALTLSLAGCKPTQSADVVATVNGHPIMRSEMEKAYDAQLGDTTPTEKPTQEQADSLRLNLLRQLIDQEIVQQRAAKMNLTATPEEVDAKFAEFKAPYPDDAQFNQRLAERHTTVDDMKRDIRRSLTIEKLLNKEINSKITISDADINNFFNQHKSEFNNIHTMYHIAQIVVTTTPIRATQQPPGLQSHLRSRGEKEDPRPPQPHRLRRRLRLARHELL